MVTKNELIEMLRLAMDFEERVNPLIAEKCEECQRELKKLEMLEQDRRKIHELCEELASRSKAHEKQIETLLREIEESRENEF